MSNQQWLTVQQVLEELEVSPSTWEKWRARRVAPEARRLPNGQLRIRRSDLDAWLNGLEAA